jgi:membrane-associated phospholipid phosphatase
MIWPMAVAVAPTEPAPRPTLPPALTTIPHRADLPTQGRRARSGSWIAGAAFGGFMGIFAIVKAKRSDEVDLAITLRLQGRRHRSVDALMRIASWPGFPPQSRIVPPTIIGALFLLDLRREAFCQSLAWGSALASEVIKGFIRRPRPLPEQVRVVIAPLGGSSFPSGHVLIYVGNYGFLAYLAHTLVEPAPVRIVIVSGLIGLVGAVGPSRIYQGHHWPTDVAASYLLGFAYLMSLIWLYRRLHPTA